MERNSSTRLDVYKYSLELSKETKKSKDPYTQVGCLLLNSDGEIVGRGHNDNLRIGTQSSLGMKENLRINMLFMQK